jgi:hypothetical protein
MTSRNPLQNVSRGSRTIFWIVLIVLVGAVIYAIFSTQIGQTALLLCCGGAIAIAAIGLVSERGMRR